MKCANGDEAAWARQISSAAITASFADVNPERTSNMDCVFLINDLPVDAAVS